MAVATRAPAGCALELDALRLAADAAKQGVDTGVYTQVRARVRACRAYDLCAYKACKHV